MLEIRLIFDENLLQFTAFFFRISKIIELIAGYLQKQFPLKQFEYCVKLINLCSIAVN